MKKNEKLKIQEDLEWNMIEDHVVIVDQHEGKVFQFNAVGTEIWKNLNGELTCDEIANKVVEKFSGPEKQVKKEAQKFIKELYSLDLIEVAGA